jgi:hypothetical protein
MTASSANIVQHVWNHSNVIRDDGVSYGDYLEHFPYLLFLKMDAENRSIGRKSTPPVKLRWETLYNLLDDSLEAVVLQEKFRPLFTEAELAEARRRLEELGYFE